MPQRWFDEHQWSGGLVASAYEQVRESVRALDSAVDALVDLYFVDAVPGKLLEGRIAFADRTTRYKDLCERVGTYWSGRVEQE